MWVIDVIVTMAAAVVVVVPVAVVSGMRKGMFQLTGCKVKGLSGVVGGGGFRNFRLRFWGLQKNHDMLMQFQ